MPFRLLTKERFTHKINQIMPAWVSLSAPSDGFQIRFREVAPKLVQLLTEWTETFPYDFRDERMMRCLKDMTLHVARGDEVSVQSSCS